MFMRKGLWLATSLLVIVSLLVGGCTGHPKGIKQLTDNEKARLIEIALNTPEVSKRLETEIIDRADVRWIAIVWENSKAVEWAVLDYEDIADGNPPQFVSKSATIYPRVLFRFWRTHFGELEQTLVMVAIDRDTEKVVLVDEYPTRRWPLLPKEAPPPAPPKDTN